MSERRYYFLASLLFLLLLLLLLVSSIPYVYFGIGLLLLCYPLIFDRSRRGFLPILMFHSVSDSYNRFPNSQLTVSRRNFLNFMHYLKFRGYATLSLNESEQYIRGERHWRRAVALTFDDGFLDNWINVAPVLEAYQQKGTIFISYDFIEKSRDIRQRRELHAKTGNLHEWGYLSEGELLVMQRSGCFDFHPHGVTHTWLFSGPELTGFHLPGDRSWWLDWNRYPAEKPDWITFYPQSRCRWGTPLFTYGKSLGVRRFFPDKVQITTFMQQVGRLNPPLTEDQLFKTWDDLFADREVPGKYESDSDYNARVLSELQQTRSYLEELLRYKCPYFCWPGGGKSSDTVKIAYEQIGYRLTTTGQQETSNRFGVPSKWFYRISAGYSKLFENRLWNLFKFIGHVETYRRNYNWILVFGLIEAIEMLAHKLGKTRRRNDWVFNPQTIKWDQP